MTSPPHELLEWHAGLRSLDRRAPSVVAATEFPQEAATLGQAVDEVVAALEALGAQLDGAEVVARQTAYAVSEITSMLRHFAGTTDRAPDARTALDGAFRVDRAWNAALAGA